MEEDPNDSAERIERRTQRILWASGLAFLAWQIAYFVLYRDPPPMARNVDRIRSIAFLVWCAALLLLVASGGGAFSGRKVRALLDDELARARRAEAYRNGFWAMIAIAFLGYAAAHFTAVATLTLAHLGLSAGVVVAVLTLARSGRA
ncbi:MAG TPA: hypothetical protein VEZ70_15220 [Allosphingosinicella sp.]|nr:hypothetical protein [Allosphingosinicella sp.]